MKKISAANTLELSIPERIQLVEDIWDTIATEAELCRGERGREKIIDARLDAYHRNPDLGSPWKDVFNRLANKR